MSRAELDSCCLGAGDTLGGALFERHSLEFADGGGHVGRQGGTAAGVDGLVDNDESPPALRKAWVIEA